MVATTSDGFHAASLRRSIAPKGRVDLGASDSGGALWEGVESDIEVSVLAIWGPGDDVPVLFVSLDLLYAGRQVRAAIEAAAGAIPADRIVVAATHTHRAPMTDDTKPALGQPDAGYIAWLEVELGNAIRAVLSTPRTPVSLLASEAIGKHSINRRLRKKIVIARRPRINDVVNGPNQHGPTDETITALTVADLTGRPVAVVWNYACHPVGGPVRNAVSGHFPATVREHVRSEFDDSTLPVLFFQGFSGDVRPNASVRIHSVRRRVRRILVGRIFEDMTWPSYVAWSSGLAKALIDAIRRGVVISPAKLETQRLSLDGSKIASGPRVDEVTFSRVDIGDALTFLTGSGEFVVDYARHIRDVLRSRHVMCIGCADHVIGYVPTERMRQEGGYEAGGFCQAFGLDGVNERVESHVMAAFDRLLAKELRRAAGGETDSPEMGADDE